MSTVSLVPAWLASRTDVVNALKEYYVNVEVEDPYADAGELKHEYGFGLVAVKEPQGKKVPGENFS